MRAVQLQACCREPPALHQESLDAHVSLIDLWWVCSTAKTMLAPESTSNPSEMLEWSFARGWYVMVRSDDFRLRNADFLWNPIENCVCSTIENYPSIVMISCCTCDSPTTICQKTRVRKHVSEKRAAETLQKINVLLWMRCNLHLQINHFRFVSTINERTN